MDIFLQEALFGRRHGTFVSQKWQNMLRIFFAMVDQRKPLTRRNNLFPEMQLTIQVIPCVYFFW